MELNFNETIIRAQVALQKMEQEGLSLFSNGTVDLMVLRETIGPQRFVDYIRLSKLVREVTRVQKEEVKLVDTVEANLVGN